MLRAAFPAGRPWMLTAVVSILLALTLSAGGAVTPGLAESASAAAVFSGARDADARQRTHHRTQYQKCLRQVRAYKKKHQRGRAYKMRAYKTCQRKARAAKQRKARAAKQREARAAKQREAKTAQPSAATPPASPSPGGTDSAGTPTPIPPGPESSPLPWAAPSLGAGHATVNVTDSPATRRINLQAGQDALIVLPDTPLTDNAPVGIGDAMVTVTGGRNVVVKGGHINIKRPPVTHLTTPVSTDGMTLTVGSTAGYPSSGVLRVDGEGIAYSSRDATHFYVSQRRKGYYNTSPVSSREIHAQGAAVYLGEAARSGMSFQKQTGTVHVEGLLIDGFVCDGLRFSGGQAIAQVQRTRIGPNTNYDLTHQTDGHPDGIQAYGGGAAEIRLAQATVLAGPNGNGLLNKGSDSGDGSMVAAWRLRNVEVVSPDGLARSLIANSDKSSIWDVNDASVRYPSGFTRTGSITSIFTHILYQAAQTDIVPAASVGIGYLPLGYL